MSEAPATAVIEMKAITKSFGGVPVLKAVDLHLEPGAVVGLLGANGAGKSTLIKILSGVYSADSGRILLDGRAVEFHTAADAQRHGIRTVHQELSLVPALTVYENVYLHAELTHGVNTPFSPLDRRAMIAGAQQVLHSVLGVQIDVTATVEDLSMAEQQLIEIARAVHEQARVLILDEPTTSLEAREKQQLFGVIRDLRAQGTAVVFISHHLDEVVELCDRTVILRDGTLVVDAPTRELTAKDMVTGMTGRPADNQYPKQVVDLGDPVLEVVGLSREPSYRDVSFTLQRGEILGIVGLAGCGKSDLIRGLYGSLPVAGGEIRRAGRPVRVRSIRQARRLGITYLPADRKTEGIFPEHSVRWNLTISALHRALGKLGISRVHESELVDQAIRDYGVKVTGPSQIISNLSGGNQQKVLLARSLLDNADVILLEDPTRGIDVSAKNDMYLLITAIVQQGRSVILVSSEETEVLGICDRILVMRDGQVRADLTPAETSLQEIRLIAMSSEGDQE